jgi:hypothetical protein
MKTNELTGKALNWAVGKAEGLDGWLAPVNYCGKWEHGGPIIEREKMDIACWDAHSMPWKASIDGGTDAGVALYVEYGPTPLIAAMRCYVASKLGEDVSIPEELK